MLLGKSCHRWTTKQDLIPSSLSSARRKNRPPPPPHLRVAQGAHFRRLITTRYSTTVYAVSASRAPVPEPEPEPGQVKIGECLDRLYPEHAEKVLQLTYPSSAEGGKCQVYLVGILHDKWYSIDLVEAVVSCLKPEITLHRKEVEVTRLEQVRWADQLQLINPTLWEKTFEETRSLKEELNLKYPNMTRVYLHERDDYMTAELKKYAGDRKSVVAVVGKFHVIGIKDRLN